MKELEKVVMITGFRKREKVFARALGHEFAMYSYDITINRAERSILNYLNIRPINYILDSKFYTIKDYIKYVVRLKMNNAFH